MDKWDKKIRSFQGKHFPIYISQMQNVNLLDLAKPSMQFYPQKAHKSRQFSSTKVRKTELKVNFWRQKLITSSNETSL